MDRIRGGSGPGGLKAVAPTGTEPITIVVTATQDGVSILGEKLSVVRVDGADAFTARPSDRRDQQRDDRVSTWATTPAGAGAAKVISCLTGRR